MAVVVQDWRSDISLAFQEFPVCPLLLSLSCFFFVVVVLFLFCFFLIILASWGAQGLLCKGHASILRKTGRQGGGGSVLQKI